MITQLLLKNGISKLIPSNDLIKPRISHLYKKILLCFFTAITSCSVYKSSDYNKIENDHPTPLTAEAFTLLYHKQSCQNNSHFNFEQIQIEELGYISETESVFKITTLSNEIFYESQTSNHEFCLYEKNKSTEMEF